MSSKLSVVFLVATARVTIAQDEKVGSLRRRVHDDHEESVSSEPLTFEYVEHEQLDRDRLLETLDGGLGVWEVMDGFDIIDGEEAMGDDGLLDDLAMANYDDFDGADYYDDDEYIADEWEPIDGAEYGDLLEMDSAYESEEYDTTYVSENGDDFSQEEKDWGEQELGEPLDFEGPVSRRLRRLDYPIGEEDMDRYLAEKMSFRNDSVPFFEPILDDNGEFDLAPYAEPDYQDELAAEGNFDLHGRDLQNGCSSGRTRFKILIKTDNSGWENRWVLKKSNGAVVARGPAAGSNYQSNRQYIGGTCLGAGTYRLTVFDSFKDGMCGSRTGRGLYRVYINNQQKFTSPSNCATNWASRTHAFRIQGSSNNNSQGSISTRDRQWLQAHNSRRQKYNGGKGYVPLKWSKTLAADAKSYAERLGNNCRNGGLTHARGIPYGENLAKNWGSGSGGNLPTPDSILRRWVENEVGKSYPQNGHFTQVVWRSTRYVGCGESVRTSGSTRCRIQVCRYARPGNCNVRNGNWRAEAWKSTTGCGNACPRGGCT